MNIFKRANFNIIPNCFIITDSCKHDENERFFVKFHNSAKIPIDVKLLDSNSVLQTVKSAIAPEGEYTHTASFKNKFVFTTSNSNDRLNASAKGTTAMVFDGCQFKAEERQLITVYILEGKKIIGIKD